MHIIHRLRRYRQHLVPLTDMDGSDDSDDEDQMSDKEPVFMVRIQFLCGFSIFITFIDVICPVMDC